MFSEARGSFCAPKWARMVINEKWEPALKADSRRVIRIGSRAMPEFLVASVPTWTWL